MNIQLINPNQSIKLKKTLKTCKINSTTYNPATKPKATLTNAIALILSNEILVSVTPNYYGTLPNFNVVYTDGTTEIFTIEITKTLPVLNTDVITDISTSAPKPLSKYSWVGNVYNSSGLSFGEKKFKGLRSIRCVTELNGHLYFSVGYPEGHSGINKTLYSNPVERIEVMKPYAGGFVAEITSMVTIGDKIYCAGFDPFAYADDNGYSSQLDCMVFSIDKTDNEVILKNGVSVRCTYQDATAPYKSVISIKKNDKGKKPVRIMYDKIDNTITIDHSDFTYSQYDLQGAFIGSGVYDKSLIKISAISILEQETTVVKNNEYCPYDFNTNEFLYSEYKANDGTYWICDVGNCRVLNLTSNGTYIREIHYLPMNYNCSVDRNVPTDVYAGLLKFKYNYSTKKTVLVANYKVGLPSEFICKDMNNQPFRNVVTYKGTTYATINKIHSDGTQQPFLVKLTDKVELIQGYRYWANIFLDKLTNVWELYYNGDTYTLLKNDVVQWSILPDDNTALSSDKAVSFTITDDGHCVIFCPHKSHLGYHLTWIKDGKVVYNAMPSVQVADNVREYPTGDAFAVNEQIQYAGAENVWTCDNKVFVKYIGEFFGGSGGQTNIFFVYENGKLLLRGGKTNWNTIEGEEAAGNAKSGDVVKVDGKYYFWNNCEHSGALQYYVID